MQEHTISIMKQLLKGLRSDSDAGRSSAGLVESKSLAPTEFGARSCQAVKQQFTVETFPFPQILRSADGTLLARASQISPVVEGESWSEDLPITFYDLNNPSSLCSIIENGTWHQAELPLGWILTNGETMLFKLGLETMFDESLRFYGQSAIKVNSCCSFRGRVVYGGWSPSNFFSATWKAVWDNWMSNAPYAIGANFESENKNFVYWTTIGGGDVLLPFAPELVSEGLLREDIAESAEDSFFLELYKRNELGFMPMPWKGEVFVVKELGNGVAVYGENGVAILTPAADPYPTFGLRFVSNTGVAGRWAVGGDKRSHVFIDKARNAWMLGSDYSLRKLGYKEFLKSLVEPLAISFDTEFESFYISDSAKCFVLTPQGLGQSHQVVASAVNTTELMGTSLDVETEAILVSDVLDFGFEDFKTITTVEVSGSYSGDAYIAVDIKYNKKDEWKRSAWVKLNRDGFGRIQKTANEFRIAVKVGAVQDVKIDRINVKWQGSGRRTVRGTYATAINAEPDI